MNINSHSMCASWFALMASALIGLPVCGFGADSVLLTNGKRVAVKTIEWRESTKEYHVETVDDIKMPIALKDVDRLDIAKPAEFDKAVQQAEAGMGDAAIPVFEGFVTKYKMMVWDVKSREILGRIYLKKKNAQKAIDALQPLFAEGGTPGGVSGATRRVYWDALLDGGRTADLEKELAVAIATGRRDAAAAAQIMRGNMLRAAGKNDEALSYYLRTVLFFDEVKDVQPEALFRTAEGLKALNDVRAEEYRKVLLQKYPDSEFAKK